MEWQERESGKWRLVDATGCIVGRIELTHDGDYMAFVGKHAAPSLGTYVTEKQAKTAVELAQ